MVQHATLPRSLSEAAAQLLLWPLPQMVAWCLLLAYRQTLVIMHEALLFQPDCKGAGPMTGSRVNPEPLNPRPKHPQPLSAGAHLHTET